MTASYDECVRVLTEALDKYDEQARYAQKMLSAQDEEADRPYWRERLAHADKRSCQIDNALYALRQEVK